MIRFRLILLGALLGILSTIGFQELSDRIEPSYPELDTPGEISGSEKTESNASASFPGISSRDNWYEDYLIVPRERLFQQWAAGENSTGRAADPGAAVQQDKSRIGTDDAGFDGAWDQRLIMADETEYFYGKEDGFPVYIKTTDKEVVRIDGSYHDLHHQEGKKFIIRDGDRMEVDFSDIDRLKLTPMLYREGSEGEQEYAEIGLHSYPAETNDPDLSPLSKPLTQQLDAQLEEEGILPPRD